MRVLILSKRQYTNKDLIDDQYGRIFELAKGLAVNNIHVTGLALSYRNRNEGQYTFQACSNQFVWNSVNLVSNKKLNIRGYLKLAKDLIERIKPDFLLASSDAMHIIVASHLGRKYGIKVVADLYDNYEAFSATKFPGMKYFFRSSLNNVFAITCASETIADLYRPVHDHVVVVENAIDTSIFYKMDRLECRRILALPEQGSLIGTAGSLYKNRDIELLFSAFARLATSNRDLYLILAGTIGNGVKIPTHRNVRYLGELDYRRVPILLNALNAAVVCNKASTFGNFCFPQKMYEILGCQTPIVAARTPAVESVLSKQPGTLYSPGNLESLKESIQMQLDHPNVGIIDVNNWQQQADLVMEKILLGSQ